jgi:hypothetical protein
MFAFYVCLFVILSLAGARALWEGEANDSIMVVAIVWLPFALLHWCAARGARLGTAWGRTTSRVVAVLLMFGFPIGSILAIYIFSRTGEKWQAAMEMPAQASLP